MKVEGLIEVASVDGYGATVDRLEGTLRARGITPMIRIDHAASATAVGLALRPLLLVVFGDPRVGTALMQEAPTAGIDLPLKLLVWEGEDRDVRIGYDDPSWILKRHGIRRDGPSGGMAALLRDVALTVSGSVGP